MKTIHLHFSLRSLSHPLRPSPVLPSSMRPVSSKAARFVTPIHPSTIPYGFTTSATYSGIKAAISPNPSTTAHPPPTDPKPDLAIIHSTTSHASSAAGTFTRNVFKAAPVVLSSTLLVEQRGRARSILINSGCANAVTGKRGIQDAERCIDQVAKLLHAKDSSTLLLSTGVIGVPLPMDTIEKSLSGLVSNLQPESNDSQTVASAEKWHQTARAFMTTDTFPKLRTRSFRLGSNPYRMLGIDKGAGMIHPSMGGPASSSGGALHATLLGFIATDAPIGPSALQSALEYAVERSFNCISVDGDMSTNDTILALANGAAAPRGKGGELLEVEVGSEEYEVFKEELTTFCQDLAKLIVRDGEGAEKFVEITVKNAPTRAHAHSIASSISTSALVKCALHGSDANWGRILCAVGYASLPSNTDTNNEAIGWQIDPNKVTVKFLPPLPPSSPLPSESDEADASNQKDGMSLSSDNSQPQELTVLLDGIPQAVDETQAARLLSLEDIRISVDLQGGRWSDDDGQRKASREEATYWTCDFSKEYVAINGDYRT